LEFSHPRCEEWGGDVGFIDDPFAAPEPKPLRLEEFSVHELEERISALEAEIGRCRALISSKQASKSAADAVFGTKST
jgi:uncharacterized small protein (DUF1192 family)